MLIPKNFRWLQNSCIMFCVRRKYELKIIRFENDFDMMTHSRSHFVQPAETYSSSASWWFVFGRWRTPTIVPNRENIADRILSRKEYFLDNENEWSVDRIDSKRGMMKMRNIFRRALQLSSLYVFIAFCILFLHRTLHLSHIFTILEFGTITQ